MTTVVISYPNGDRDEVLLAGVPRAGDSIRLTNGRPGATLLVLHVLWIAPDTKEPGPQVVIEVRDRDAR